MGKFKDLFERENADFLKIRAEYVTLATELDTLHKQLDKVIHDTTITTEAKNNARRPIEKRIHDNLRARENLEVRFDAKVNEYSEELDKITPLPKIQETVKDLPQLIESGVFTDAELLKLGRRSNDLFSMRLLSREMLRRSEEGGTNAPELREMGIHLQHESQYEPTERALLELANIQRKMIRSTETAEVNNRLFETVYDAAYAETLENISEY